MFEEFQRANIEMLERIRAKSIELRNEIASRQNLVDSIGELSLND